MITGRVRVGSDVIVGANTIVVEDVPACARMVSASARNLLAGVVFEQRPLNGQLEVVIGMKKVDPVGGVVMYMHIAENPVSAGIAGAEPGTVPASS